MSSNKVNSKTNKELNTSKVDKPLTKNEELFCQLYLKNFCNATAAYKEWKPNVKDLTARVEACKLLAKPNVRACIEKLQEEQSKALMITRDTMVQMRMAHIKQMQEGVTKGYYDAVQKKTVTYTERDNRTIEAEFTALERLFGLDKPKEINVKVGPDPVHVELLDALQNVKVEGVDDVDGNTETDTDIGSSS